MRTITLKELMVRLDDCATVSQETTLRDVVFALEPDKGEQRAWMYGCGRDSARS